MPPSSAAIWLAESPSAQSFLRSSTRSSVQFIRSLLFDRVDQRRMGATESALLVWQPYGRPDATLDTRGTLKTAAARYVVFDGKNATICRESHARVGPRESTPSYSDAVSTCRAGNKWRRAGTVLTAQHLTLQYALVPPPRGGTFHFEPGRFGA